MRVRRPLFVLVMLVILVGAAIPVAAQDPSAANPDLTGSCGLNVILILDESGSMDGTPAAQLRTAAETLLDSLVNTSTNLAIVEFNTTARRPFEYTELTTATLPAFEEYLDDTDGSPSSQRYRPEDYGGSSQYTNWQAAFDEAYAISNTGPVADIVLFLTDGVPTTSTGPYSDLVDGIQSANAVKGQDPLGPQTGTHIFGVGINLSSGTPESNLIDVTGPDEYPDDTTDIKTADYTLSTGAALEAALRAVAFELCGGSLTVTKYVDDGHGYVTMPNFGLIGNVTTIGTAPNSWAYTWIEPPPGGHASSSDITRGGLTAADGTFIWQWRPDLDGANAPFPAQVILSEAGGVTFDSASCDRIALDSNNNVTDFDPGPLPATISWGAGARAADIVTCDLFNSSVDWDWGDAPDSYGTTAALGGPRHIYFAGGPIIGSLIDNEVDGQPSIPANGDDIDSSADEDGLAIAAGADWNDGTAEVDVTLTNGPACLNAWVDFNNDANTNVRDGDFNDPGEQVFTNVIVPDGFNALSFTMPNNVALDTMLYLRFRLTPLVNGQCDDTLYADGSPTPYNQAFGGEVQDWRVIFSPTAITLSNQTIGGGSNNGLLASGVALLALALLSTAVLLVQRRKQEA